jgi:5-methylcytosine-specific restriction endonuclease McrA
MATHHPLDRRGILLALADVHGPACHYCGWVPGALWELTLDHIWPRALGGTNRRRNLVLACRPCNAGYGADPVKCDCRRCRKARLAGALALV